jgi:hypothetical protein
MRTMPNRRGRLKGATISLVVAALMVSACGRTGTDSPQAGAPQPDGSPNAQPAGNPAVVPAPPPVRVVKIPEGTQLRVRTTTALSTKTATPGMPFTGVLAEPLVVNGQTIAAKGSSVDGQVAEADPGGRVRGVAHLSVRLTQVRLDDGRQLDVNTSSVTRVAPKSKKDDAVKIGIASGVGAAIGAIAGGGKGAAIGAGAGAGAGTGAVLATRGDPAVIASESLLTFKLQNPIEIRR